MLIPASVPEGAAPQNHTILAWGEATGHHHTLEALQLSGEYMVCDRNETGEVFPHYISGADLLKRYGQQYVESDAAPVLYERDGKLYFRASGTSIVKHQEHGTIVVPPGEYHNRIQREYQPGEVPRSVID